MNAVTSGCAVPVIDIAGYFDGDAESKRAIAAQIDAAARSVGFFVVAGHRVDTGLGARMHAVSRRFYDLGDDVKRSYASGSPAIYRGYFAMGGLAAARSMEDRKAAPDYREMFVASKMAFDAADPYYGGDIGRKIFTANIWPAEIPGFVETWTEYYSAMERFSTALMRLCALALGLPETWFDRAFAKHMSTLAVTNYPDQIVAPGPGQLRCGAHTDYGALTLLMSENKPGGLEVRTRDGAWEPVPMIPDTFVINVGDLMQRWTNDRWLSNLHRVANPPRDAAEGSRRQSLIFFLHPNYDAVIECLPSCAAGGAKHPPTTTRDHLLAKINAMQDVTA